MEAIIILCRRFADFVFSYWINVSFCFFLNMISFA